LIDSNAIALLYRQHRGKVTGLLYNPTSDYLYSCNAVGSLALHDARDDKYQLMRLLGNTVARGDSRGLQALTISEDGRHLAFVGPTDLTISVVDAKSLDEVNLGLVHCIRKCNVGII
jgi:WD40 repeat protein